MSEPFAERLSRFTPDAGKLDRDALLFAAGRASARPRRPWMALSGVLAASQLTTLLFFLWPHTPAASSAPPTFPIAVRTPETPPAPEPSSWLSVRQQLVAAEGNPPAPPSDDSLVPQDPPLRAFGSPPSTLLN